jgi:hypothetical protein
MQDGPRAKRTTPSLQDGVVASADRRHCPALHLPVPVAGLGPGYGDLYKSNLACALDTGICIKGGSANTPLGLQGFRSSLDSGL